MLAVAALMGSAGAANALDVVRVGTASSTSDAPIFIAIKKGFFREEGIDAQPTDFRSAADMVAPLGAGQLDVGAGAATAGLYNAIGRGIKLRVVADKASSLPGYPATKILVRKDLVDSGRYKGPKDFKGMKVALNAKGVSNASSLNDALKLGGLKYSDIETVEIAFPNHGAAYQNKAIDASTTTEPSATLAIKNGVAVQVFGDDEIAPGHQIAGLIYAEDFASKRDVAKRFMRGYLKGARFYNGALANGRFAGANADEVISILIESTPVKSREIYKEITPVGINPDGRVNLESLKHDFAFFGEQKLITGSATPEQVVDNSFVDAAVAELGPYKK
jgi:NitT/TauT family transport system substrate-binding protein